MNSLIQFSPRDTSLIRRTVAKDCDDAEFDMFIHICRQVGLDPLRRQIYAFVFHKGDANKRQLTPVVAIDGLRAIAERTNNYRPDDEAPRIEYDEAAKDADKNPLGIVSCTVRVYKFVHGEWFPAVGQAFWDEYVPLKDGKIDWKKTGWTKMPRIMIAKCAEAVALRRAWPDDFGMLYEGAEMDRREVLDLTPTEAADFGEQEDRLEKIGGANAILFDWMDGAPLDRVPLNSVAERIERFISENEGEPMTVRAFQDRNAHALREFWALKKTDALEIKRELAKAETVKDDAE